ncbi:MAG: OmpA family protein [Elusimicrobiota bacterium]
MKRRLSITILIAFAFASGAFAAFDTMPESSVRAQGMGGAFSGMSDDVMSALINPSGLVRIDGDSVGMSYASLYPGLVNDSISQSLVAAAVRGDITAWGLSAAQLSSAKYKEIMIVLTPSYAVTDTLLLGANIKFMRWNAATAQYFNDTSESLGKSSYGLDLGCQYLFSDSMVLGLTLANLNRPDIGSVGQELLPLNVRTGILYFRPGGLNFAADVNMQNNKQAFALGLEQWFSEEKYALRGGWEGTVGGGSVSMGASYKTGERGNYPFVIDFAYIYPLVLKNLPVMRLSTTFRFGKKADTTVAYEPGDESEAPEGFTESGAQPRKMEGAAKINDLANGIQLGELTQLKFEVGTDKPSQGYDTLDLIGQILLDYPELNINIEVHTDPLGDPDANTALTYKQGAAVKEYLVKKYGVAAKRIEVIGYGGSRPIASVNEPFGIDRNRRVEIHAQE